MSDDVDSVVEWAAAQGLAMRPWQSVVIGSAFHPCAPCGELVTTCGHYNTGALQHWRRADVRAAKRKEALAAQEELLRQLRGEG